MTTSIYAILVLSVLFAKSCAFVPQQAQGWLKRSQEVTYPLQLAGKGFGKNSIPNEESVASNSDFETSQLSSSDPLYGMSDERKANLFQFLLRDLQVEGAPLLSVDSVDFHTLQAALWTTLAELMESDDSNKACLIFEQIPIPALKSLVDGIMVLKEQPRLMASLPELERFNVSLVGKGVGPAILLEVGGRNETNPYENSMTTVSPSQTTAAMKMFVDRINSYLYSARDVSDRLESIAPVPVEYRSCAFSEVCHILSAFWNSVCEIQTTPSDQLQFIMLSFPATNAADHERFVAVAEVVSRSLSVYHRNIDGDNENLLEIQHFSPAYDRDEVSSNNEVADGHLPPTSWLQAMLRHTDLEDENRVKAQLVIKSNFQRRAPINSVCIKRSDSVDGKMDETKGITELTLENGGGKKVVPASIVLRYAWNAVAMNKQDQKDLRQALEKEIEIANRQ
jgi:hypothetical protein